VKRSQDFSFGFSDYLLSDLGEVPLGALHDDAAAIARTYERVEALAKRLKVLPPKPHLAGFAYPHMAALGAEVLFPPDSEPKPLPLLRSPADIDRLAEPADYLAAPLIQKRLHTLAELQRLRPDALATIGHGYEGPITTAVLLLGPDFFTLVYDDPPRAHALLDFSVRSALHYFAAITRQFGGTLGPRPAGFPDDFAGMLPPELFPEFVVPYWERFYRGLQATGRWLHSELLRPAHLPFLAELKVTHFDACGDQYVTPEILKAQCPVPFMLNLHSWEVHNHTIPELQALYRRLASFEPTTIALEYNRLPELPKIEALLEVAWELKG
jgi:hypothetical protein